MGACGILVTRPVTSGHVLEAVLGFLRFLSPWSIVLIQQSVPEQLNV